MIKNERIFSFLIIPKENSKLGFVDKIVANTYREAQDKIDLKYRGKLVRCVYQGIDAGAKNGSGR